ncbi:MAG: DUF423 domain-containing protein [Thermoactinomyces sp.]
MRLFVILGSINMAIAISMGAFGAHGLADQVTEKMLATWNTGAEYHLIHALGLIAVGLLLSKRSDAADTLLKTGGWLLFAGIVLFSGSLYILVLTGIRNLGIITPFGGTSFVIGWLIIALAASKKAIH